MKLLETSFTQSASLTNSSSKFFQILELEGQKSLFCRIDFFSRNYILLYIIKRNLENNQGLLLVQLGSRKRVCWFQSSEIKRFTSFSTAFSASKQWRYLKISAEGAFSQSIRDWTRRFLEKNLKVLVWFFSAKLC